MIDFKQIETFVWVAELGGFRAAAEKLNTTQPAISQRIAALEQTLNTRLFTRDTRGIQITDKGQELLTQAQRMLDLRNDMMQTACAQNAVRGTLRLGVAETIAHTWLHALLERLSALYPALVVEIHVDTTQVMRPQVAAHQIDLALLVGVGDDPKLQHLHLCNYPVVWAASPALHLDDRLLKARELAAYPIITYPANSQPYRAVRGTLLAAGIKTPRMYGCASLSTIVHMTRRGIGVSAIAPEVMQDELAQGSIRILNVRDSLPELSFYACWLDSPDSYIVRTVAQVAQEVAHAAHSKSAA
ncbi:MAG: LysR family transcriptional regulator [Corticimicrobacter sp.]|uniref:LysR family transcriptional regulator n=1 Tax=Corticimicrobacter sp. TaxID=2678536 RepID=UPI0032D9E519